MSGDMFFGCSQWVATWQLVAVNRAALSCSKPCSGTYAAEKAAANWITFGCQMR